MIISALTSRQQEKATIEKFVEIGLTS